MEAQKLKSKKKLVGKDKLKKTIKNVICRPDPTFWPNVVEAEENILQSALKQHRVHIPVFNKPHWNDIKSIPKKNRPKPPVIPKVDGLIFGISDCCNALKTQNCTAILIEANVNPQIIVQPVIEECTANDIPVLCIKDLRQISFKNFGIKTSCLGVRKDFLKDLSNAIQEIYQKYKYVKKCVPLPVPCLSNENLLDNIKKEELEMDVDSYCPYVYRTDKKSRAFVPEDTQKDTNTVVQFTGQSYIKVSQDSNPKYESNRAYMKMILKKMSNNPNRAKVKFK